MSCAASGAAPAQGGGQCVSKIAAANKAKSAKITAAVNNAAPAADTAAPAGSAGSASAAPSNRVGTRSVIAASVSSLSSQAMKNPGKNLYISMFIRFNLYNFV